MYIHISQNMDKEFPESTEIATWTNVSSLPTNTIFEFWWSCRWLTFAYFKPFMGLKCMAGPDWLKKKNEHQLCIQSFTEVSHLQIWWVWIHCRWQVAAQNQRRGRMQETKKTSSYQTTAVQEITCWHQQKLHTRCIAFGESVVQILTRTTWTDVNKIKDVRVS